MTEKDLSKARQELIERGQKLGRDIQTGIRSEGSLMQDALGIQRDSNQLYLDTVAQTEALRANRQALEAKQAERNEAVHRYVMDATAPGGEFDEREFRTIWGNRWKVLGPIIGLLEPVFVRGAVRQVLLSDTDVFLKCSAVVQGREVFNIFAKPPIYQRDWARDLKEGEAVDLAILCEKIPSQWLTTEWHAYKGQSYLFAVPGFHARAKAGDILEATVTKGDKEWTHARVELGGGQTESVILRNGMIASGLFGRKNKEGKRFQVVVKKVTRDPIHASVEFEFRSGTSFR